MVQAIFAAFVLGLITAISPLSAQEPASGPRPHPRDATARDTTGLKPANLDSLRKRLLSVSNDSIHLNAWRSLKDIGPAIAIGLLDGPDDIGERIEIIEDRIDALLREKGKLALLLDLLIAGRQSQETQIEVLEDLSETEINRTNDMQRQQRLHDLQQRANQLSRRILAYRRALSELKKEHNRLKHLVKQYQKKIEILLKNEGLNP